MLVDRDIYLYVMREAESATKSWLGAPRLQALVFLGLRSTAYLQALSFEIGRFGALRLQALEFLGPGSINWPTWGALFASFSIPWPFYTHLGAHWSPTVPGFPLASKVPSIGANWSLTEASFAFLALSLQRCTGMPNWPNTIQCLGSDNMMSLFHQVFCY